MKTIFHITTRDQWNEARTRGEYRAPSLESEGFIHCSTEKQVVHVADAFYRGQVALVLLEIDPTKLKPALKWEPPAGPPAERIDPSSRFPHIYGAINLDAVVASADFTPGEDGTFFLPRPRPMG